MRQGPFSWGEKVSNWNCGCEVGKEEDFYQPCRWNFGHTMIWTLGVGRYSWYGSEKCKNRCDSYQGCRWRINQVWVAAHFLLSSTLLTHNVSHRSCERIWYAELHNISPFGSMQVTYAEVLRKWCKLALPQSTRMRYLCSSESTLYFEMGPSPRVGLNQSIRANLPKVCGIVLIYI